MNTTSSQPNYRSSKLGFSAYSNIHNLEGVGPLKEKLLKSFETTQKTLKAYGGLDGVVVNLDKNQPHPDKYINATINYYKKGDLRPSATITRKIETKKIDQITKICTLVLKRSRKGTEFLSEIAKNNGFIFKKFYLNPADFMKLCAEGYIGKAAMTAIKNAKAAVIALKDNGRILLDLSPDQLKPRRIVHVTAKYTQPWKLPPSSFTSTQINITHTSKLAEFCTEIMNEGRKTA